VAETASTVGGKPERLDRALNELVEVLTGMIEKTAHTDELLEQCLTSAESEETFAKVRSDLGRLKAESDGLALRLRGLAGLVDRLEREWLAGSRYTEGGLRRLEQELVELVRRQPVEGARRWLHEIIDSVRLHESEALHQIAAAPLPFRGELRGGAERIRSSLVRWRKEEDKPPIRLWEDLGKARLSGWKDVLDPTLRSRAYRVAAWVALRLLHDPERAKERLDDAVELDPTQAANLADRAAYFLYVGELEAAAADARRAVGLDPEYPAAYFQLGIWSELTRDFDEASKLYGRALRRLSTHAVATLSRRASLLDPPGRLLLAAAEVLVGAGRAQAALETAEAALAALVRGAEPYPEADVYRVKGLALEQLDRKEEAAAATVEAGKRSLWNGKAPLAVEQLRRALELDPSSNEARWLLADALNVQSFPPSAAAPDFELVGEARRVWTEAFEKDGPPAGDLSWAYLTRATIASNETKNPRNGASEAWALRWEAVIDVERALVHRDTVGLAWGFAAKHLREVGLHAVAFEASDRAWALSPSDYLVLTERIALLADQGLYDEAAAMADDVVARYDTNPALTDLQAWLAFRRGRYSQVLELLESPLAEESELRWSYSLHALSKVALGDIPSARADFRTISTELKPVNGQSKCAIATARAAIGHVRIAERCLQEAGRDPTAPGVSYLEAATQVALAAEDWKTAAELAADAVREARNRAELDDLANGIRRFLQLIADSSSASAGPQAVFSKTFEAKLEARRRWLRNHVPEPDQELAAAFAEHDSGRQGQDLDAATVALLAVAGRRAALAKRADDAVAKYERLCHSAFEPEATIVLKRTLRQANAELTERGDVDGVRRIQGRLRALGAVDDVEAALAVAAALEASGRRREAREELSKLAGRSDEGGREKLYTRIGELALADGDVAAARAAFSSALGIARTRPGPGRIARLEIRLALVSLVSGDGSAEEHVTAALKAWRQAGAFEPALTLVDTFRGLLLRGGASPSAEPFHQAVEELQATIERLRAEGQLADYGQAERAEVAASLDDLVDQVNAARPVPT